MSFDFEALLADPLFRNALTPEELRQAQADEGWQWLVDLMGEGGKVVLTLGWDSSMPGTCGATWRPTAALAAPGVHRP